MEEPQKISEIQSLFLDCLLCILAKNRGKEKATKTFIKLIEFITEVRPLLYERQRRYRDDLGYDFCEDVKLPWVAGEVFGVPDRYIIDLNEDFTSLTLD